MKNERATKGERIELLELRMNFGFDPRKEVERIMDEHPTATQDEIYAIAFRDQKFVGCAVIEAVTNAMLAIAGTKAA